MAIPVYERQLGIEPLPGVRAADVVRPLGVPADIGADMAGAASELRKAVMLRIEEYEDVNTLEAFNNFQREVSDYHRHPEKGIYRAKLGKGALGAADAADEWIGGKADEYAGKLPRRAAENFRRMAAEARNKYYADNQDWEAKQFEAYRDAEADGTIGNSLAAIAGNFRDDAAEEEERRRIYQALELKTRGLGGEAWNAAVADMEYAIAAARLGETLRNAPLEALPWLESRRDKLPPDAYGKLLALAEKEGEPYRVEAIRDEILSVSDNERDAREYVRDNFEGDLERKIMSAVEAEFADRRRIKNQEEADAYDAALDAVAASESYGAALSAISKSGLAPRLTRALKDSARTKFGISPDGAAKRTIDPNDWIDAKTEALEFQRKSGNMNTAERNAAAKEFAVKWTGRISSSGIRTLSDVFFRQPGGSAVSKKDPYDKFNPYTHIGQMAKDAGIKDDSDEDMAFWGEFSKRANERASRLGRPLDGGELLELGKEMTADIVVSKKNNWAERFIGGVIGAFSKEKGGGFVDWTAETDTELGYAVPEGAYWDDDIGALVARDEDGEWAVVELDDEE